MKIKEVLKAKLREVNKKLRAEEFEIGKRDMYSQFEYGYLKGQRNLLNSLLKEMKEDD